MKPCVFIVIACWACLLPLTIPAIIKAQSRFENGFRGIAWQTSKEELPDLGLSKKALKNIYKTGPASVLFMEGHGNLAMVFDDIPLLSIFMHFHNQNLSGADLLFKPENREKIVSIITAETGEPGLNSSEETCWETAHVKILVTDRELMVNSK